MTRHTIVCTREDEVLELVAIEQWPLRADAELRAHAEQCAVCRDLVAAAGAVIALRESATPVAVPDARVVWYRAQMRARTDATRRATRPMLVIQVVAAMAIVALVGAWTMMGGAELSSLWQWMRAATPSPDAEALRAAATTASGSMGPLVYWGGALLVGWALIASAVVYVTRLADRGE